MNRDLPLRLEDMLRREVGAVSGGVRAAVGPAVSAAVAEALPRELAGPAMQVGSQTFYSILRQPHVMEAAA